MILPRCGISRGDIVFITLYWREIKIHLSRLPSRYGTLQMKFAEIRRLVAHFNLRPTITDSMDATEFSGIAGQLSFSQVSFSYPGQELAFLKDVSFSIQPRTVVALVGPNGCGKSQLSSSCFGFMILTLDLSRLIPTTSKPSYLNLFERPLRWLLRGTSFRNTGQSDRI